MVRRLIQRGETLATVEYDSPGLLAGWLAAADRSRTAFLAATVGSKAFDVLHAGTASTDPAERCRQAATEMRLATGSTYGLAIGTVCAEGSQGEIVHVALATANAVDVEPVSYGGHPDVRLPRLAKSALDLVRRRLV